MEKKKFWYQKQLRMLQTVLREPDLESYDAKAVVKYLVETNSNAIIVNAGGIIDFFRYNGKMGRQNSFMTDENMLGDLIKECHENQIAVMVRVDFRGVEHNRYQQQPDWFACDSDGNSKKGWNDTLHKPCYNGIYANDHAVEYIEQMMRNYDVDGVWENSVGFGDGPCYCKVCRDQYKKDTGKEIPVHSDYASELFSKYREWKAGCAHDHLKRMRDTVKRFGEDKAYCAEIFGMFHASNALYTGIDLYDAKDLFDFLVSPAFLDGCAQQDKKYDDLTYAASSMRFLKAIDPSKETVLLYGNNGTKWRYVMAPAQETRIWLWEAASVGAGYWNCMFNGQYPDAAVDRRNAYLEKDVYTYLKDNEAVLDGQTPVLDVGIYYSKYTRDALGKEAEKEDGYGVFIKGVERVLNENHIQYNFIPDLGFSPERIRHLKTLILPNVAYISDYHLELIRDYVYQGGGIVASYQTSLYDEKGKQRDDFGLKDLFGCSFTGIKRDTSSDCYQKVRGKHELLANMDIDNTSMIMNEGETLLCTSLKQDTNTVICNYVPQIFNQPPEFAWIPDTDTDYPTVTVNRYGAGKVVYFSNQTDKLCYTNGHQDFLKLFHNAVCWTAGGMFSVRTNAPESVHIVLTEKQEDPHQKVLSLVNTTSGTMRPVSCVLPVHNIEVTLILDGKELQETKVLRQDDKVEITKRQEGGKLEVQVKVLMLQEFTSIFLYVI